MELVLGFSYANGRLGKEDRKQAVEDKDKKLYFGRSCMIRFHFCKFRYIGRYARRKYKNINGLVFVA